MFGEESFDDQQTFDMNTIKSTSMKGSENNITFSTEDCDTDADSVNTNNNKEASQENRTMNPWIRSRRDWYKIESHLDQGRIIAADPPLPACVNRRVKALKANLRKQKKIEKQFFKELLALEAKYNALQTPMYDQRASIIQEVKKYVQNDKSCTIKLLPFWERVLLHAPLLQDVIEEYDQPILAFIEDIRVVYSDNGFKLDFYFESNPYFKNDVLSIECKKRFDAMHYDTSLFCKGTKIKWKSGKNVTLTTISKKKKQDKSKMSKKMKRSSFFNLFGAEGDMTAIPHDILVVDYIKNRLVNRALFYYTGEGANSPFEDFFRERLDYIFVTFMPKT